MLGGRTTRGWRGDAAAIGVFGAATVAAYWQIVGRGFVLLGFDALVYFYPLIAYRDARLQAGELPLWAADYFLGVPFLANPQTGVLYPPNWLTIALDPPRAYAWQAFGHTALLGLGIYLFARHGLRLGALAGLVAALVAALGGYGQSLVGHLNQLQAAAWIGFVFLAADRAWGLRSPGLAAQAGVLLAVQVLAGHAQQSFMTVAALGVWLAGRVLGAGPHEPARDLSLIRRALWALLVHGAAGVVAGLLAAPQLLPTLELTAEGIRAGGLGYREAAAFSLPPWLLPLELLPLYTPADQPGSEWTGYVGVVGVFLAVLGVATGKPRRTSLVLAALALGALALAFGQFDPLYPWLFQLVPGLGLFRVPARWLFVWSFALALLAALGTERLARGFTAQLSPRAARGIASFAAGTLIVLAGGAAAALGVAGPMGFPAISVLAVWALLAATAVALAWWARAGAGLAPPVLVALLGAELIAASWPLDLNRAGPIEASGALRPTEAHLLAAMDESPGADRVLAITDSGFDPGDLTLLRSEVEGVVGSDRVEDWVAAVKHKDVLTPNLPLRFGIPSIDGYDGGVLPLRSYVGLKELFPLRAANLADGRLGIQLDRVPPIDLLSWLNVGWVVMDRHRDIWVDGAYYDLAVQTPLIDAPLVLDGLSPRARATAVGVVAWTIDGAPPSVLEVEVTGTDGSLRRARFGSGPALSAPDARSQMALLPARPGAEARYLGRTPLGRALGVARIAVRSGGGHVVLGGLTLIDEERGVDWPVPASPGLRYSALGDVKIYRNTAVLPRAFLVHGVRPVADDAAARGEIAAGMDPRAVAALVGADDAAAALDPGPAEPGESVEIVERSPERITLRATLRRRGVLVLADAAYPGWTATLDGVPAPILRANGGVRALHLEAGVNEVVFTYRSARLELGAALASAGVLVALGLALLGRVARPRPAP